MSQAFAAEVRYAATDIPAGRLLDSRMVSATGLLKQGRAAWTGSGNTGGTLDPLTRTWTWTVPVAEVQTIVTS